MDRQRVHWEMTNRNEVNHKKQIRKNGVVNCMKFNRFRSFGKAGKEKMGD